MKSVRNKTVLGLAIGERSLLAAELIDGDRPVVKRLAQIEYPPQTSPADPAQLSSVLESLRKQHGFTARTVIIGLPAKWIVVKPKEVPPTDSVTIAEILRTGAEAEFSADLKNLTFDFVDSASNTAGKTVLLVGTPSKYIQAMLAACQSAKLTCLGITSSALVLGAASAKSPIAASLVLAVGSTGAELTVQQNGAPSSVQHLRAPEPAASFVSAVRRAVSTLSLSSTDRRILLWDQTGLSAKNLSEQLGVEVRSGELSALGVDVTMEGINGAANRYASAVALGLSALNTSRPVVDFLHSRLAPPTAARYPRWLYLAATVVLLLVALLIYSYAALATERTQVAAEKDKLAKMDDNLKSAKRFVARVSFAQAWQTSDPRYLAALRGLTEALSDDDRTYATSVTLREASRTGSAAVSTVEGEKLPPVNQLAGTINGKASDPHGWSILQSRLQSTAGFTDVKLHSTSNEDRQHEVSFSISFNYDKPAPAVPARTGKH